MEDSVIPSPPHYLGQKGNKGASRMSSPRWAFIAGSYRTASTTQYEITRDIVEGTRSGIGIGYHTESRLKERDEDTRKGYIVVCKVFKFLPQHSPFGKQFLEENRLKALCTIRDPRDIIVSMKARSEATRNMDFDFKQTVTENFPIWLGQLEQWIDLGPEITMVTKYEDMIVNLYKEAKRIAEHLGISADDDLLKTIAKNHTIQAMVKAKKEYRSKAQKAKARGEEPPREDPWLPSIPAIKFGTSGQWRTWLSTGEITLVNETCAKFMERFGYPI